jgi:hypothetical protein
MEINMHGNWNSWKLRIDVLVRPLTVYLLEGTKFRGRFLCGINKVRNSFFEFGSSTSVVLFFK